MVKTQTSSSVTTSIAPYRGPSAPTGLWAVPWRFSHRARGGLSTALATVACCVLAPQALASPRLTQLGDSSSECVFDFAGVAADCESTDPTFEVEFTSDDGTGNDSSG